MNPKVTPLSMPIYAEAGSNSGFVNLLLDHKRELLSGLSLSGLGLGFWTLYSYASLIGRPELFLSSISIGPSLFAWVATFVFFVFVFFFFVCANSLVFIYLVSIINARSSLREYVSRWILICLMAVFSVTIMIARGTNSTVLAISGGYFFCLGLLVWLSMFSRGGELVLINALRVNKSAFKASANVAMKKRKEAKAYIKAKKIFDQMISKKIILWIYAGSGLYLFFRLLRACIFLLGVMKIRFPFFLRKSLLFVLLALAITLFSLVTFYPAYLVYKLANASGDDAFRAFLVAVVAFQYGILPGVLYYRSISKGWAKIRQVAVAFLVSLFVIFAVAKGVYSKLLVHTALSMGVRVDGVGVYLVDKKYPMELMKYTSWSPEQVGGFTKVRGMIAYQFSSITYLCPPDFDGTEVELWANRSSECLLGDKESILPFADRPQVSQ